MAIAKFLAVSTSPSALVKIAAFSTFIPHGSVAWSITLQIPSDGKPL